MLNELCAVLGAPLCMIGAPCRVQAMCAFTNVHTNSRTRTCAPAHPHTA
jgi:hypothetical protein